MEATKRKNLMLLPAHWGDLNGNVPKRHHLPRVPNRRDCKVATHQLIGSGSTQHQQNIFWVLFYIKNIAVIIFFWLSMKYQKLNKQ